MKHFLKILHVLILCLLVFGMALVSHAQETPLPANSDGWQSIALVLFLWASSATVLAFYAFTRLSSMGDKQGSLMLAVLEATKTMIPIEQAQKAFESYTQKSTVKWDDALPALSRVMLERAGLLADEKERLPDSPPHVPPLST